MAERLRTRPCRWLCRLSIAGKFATKSHMTTERRLARSAWALSAQAVRKRPKEFRFKSDLVLRFLGLPMGSSTVGSAGASPGSDPKTSNT